MAQVGARSEILVSFNSSEHRIGVPVSTYTFPMFMDGHHHPVCSCQAVDTVPHVDGRFGRNIPYAKLFRFFKVILPILYRFSTADIERTDRNAKLLSIALELI